jgi:hypothetical protein
VIIETDQFDFMIFDLINAVNKTAYTDIDNFWFRLVDVSVAVLRKYPAAGS